MSAVRREVRRYACQAIVPFFRRRPPAPLVDARDKLLRETFRNAMDAAKARPIWPSVVINAGYVRMLWAPQVAEAVTLEAYAGMSMDVQSKAVGLEVRLSCLAEVET